MKRLILTISILLISTTCMAFTVDDLPNMITPSFEQFAPDPSASDQGAADTSKVTLYNILESKDTDDYFTVIFHHDRSGATTTYNFNTALDLGSYPNMELYFENGAMLSGGTVTIYSPANIKAGHTQQIFSSSATITFTFAGLRHVGWWGAAGDGTTDDTDAVNAAILAGDGGVVMFFAGLFLITDTVLNTAVGNRGALLLKGVGSTYHTTSTPTSSHGTTLIWDGDEDGTMFEFGSASPIWIGGVLQSYSYAQFNNQMTDMSIIFHSGIERVVYVHDQDGFQAERMYIDGHSRKTIRGVFDYRGSVNNIKMDQVTISNIPNGYGIRNGDGSTNTQYDQVFIGNVGLGLWIGDTATYEDPYQNSSFTYSNGTFEGFSGEGKFEISELSAGASSGAYTIDLITGGGLLCDVDDPIYIGRGEDNFEMNKIESISSNEITLTYPLEYTHISSEIVKVGSIGVHLGNSSASAGRTADIVIDRPMFDKYGCGIDVHDVNGLDIRNPIFTSDNQRGLYIDGDTQNIDLRNPIVLANQLTTWRLFEITAEGSTWDFRWWGGADAGDVSQPYINSQGECNGTYIGSLQQVSGSLPAYFRGLSFDSNGIVVEEATASTAQGFTYKVAGDVMFKVSEAGVISNDAGEIVFADPISLGNGKITLQDTAEPASPGADEVVFFVERWGGKGHVYALFPTGAKVLIATEP